MLKNGERIDDLNLNGLKIIQHENKFKFGMDAILLSNFVYTKRGDKIIDLGCGTGIIPILIAGKSSNTHVTGVEIQRDVADIAKRNVVLNNLTDRIEIINDDIRNIVDKLGVEKYDIVTTNPPYMPHKTGFDKSNESENISRYEINGGLQDFVKVASKLLKFGGKFFMVHRVDRLVDIVYNLRICNLEPKKIRFVHPYVEEKPNLVLVEAKKGAKSGVVIMKPLYIYNREGKYTDELLSIYGKTTIEEE
ncbi:methyltransferase small [Thermoanaerobacterium thermosaccharolyticum DSM 571]|uniref:Methyltransferase small n=1 Tax=Thermoanaerobacterium thermosaccharolyticum (strain ATCC 7956 / DSM 571 / NCIMB 9385 / NCA 3814 / NCTC 13789 / WDCM 00135 / 2032) TaxID=580327 RepID=D9TND2_THETC|nr:tRNA1(Val) (adenine(37)-N6)-methyltransferase [Thermoanaerobacterium thermosaccharolyticum]ADL67675.1 methyltransferase small [Thermoanaerobacterium thermosaccharolyticum DSM 571]